MSCDKPYSSIIYDLNKFKEEICDKRTRPEFNKPINEAYRQLIEKCWSPNPEDRPTFSEIMTELETNDKYITNEVNKEEFYEYIKYIKETKATFISSNHLENLDKYIDFHLKRYPKFDININLKNINQTEDNHICFHSKITSLDDLIKKKLISNQEYQKVYKFTDTKSGKFYIGIIPKEKICYYSEKFYNFTKKLELYSKLNHPSINLLKKYSLNNFKNEPFPIILSQYASNTTLYNFIDSEDQGYSIKEWDDTKRLICLYGIASGIKYLHENNIIYGNLKPEYILIDDYLFPKIIYPFFSPKDYNISERKTDIYEDPCTKYEETFSPASDVFSFSLIMYQILMKKRISLPNTRSNTKIQDYFYCGKRPEFFGNIPKVYRQLINLCWSPNLDERPTFSEIVNYLGNNPKFVRDSINKKEYYKYVQYINQNKNDFDKYSFNEYKIKFPQINKQKNFLVKMNPIDLSKYEKHEQIGKGGFGSVYKVIDKETNEVYAAKVSINEILDSDNDVVMNLSREVEIISQLNHPSVLKFIGFSAYNFKNKQKPTIITEFAYNGSLDKIIELEKNNIANPDWDDTKRLINIYGIAAGMKYLHNKNIIHRDLKPANIFMDKSLYPKIGDFGLSKGYDAHVLSFNLFGYNQKNPIYLSPENESDNNSGFKGTFAYSAPEILKYEKYTEKSDVYAFGMIVYEIMTGEILFEGMNRYQVILKIGQGYRPEFKYPIPYCYRKLIEKCWKDNPSERPSFRHIVFNLENKPEFITENVDKEEFLNYIEYTRQTNFYQNTNTNNNNNLQNDNFIDKIIDPDGNIEDQLHNLLRQIGDYEKRKKSSKENIEEEEEEEETTNFIDSIINPNGNIAEQLQIFLDQIHNYIKRHSETTKDDEKQNEKKKVNEEHSDNSINKSFLNLDDFKKIKDITKGDFYKVSKVQNIKTGKYYTAKESIIRMEKLSRDEILNLSREIKVISKINHPSFLKFIGYSLVNFKKESKPVIITELSTLGTLEQILKIEKKDQPIKGWNDTKKLINIYGIAAGMSYLHSNDIIHRNLKTSSIFVDNNLFPKIGDFGFSTQITLNDSLTFQSTSGIKGTPVYSAPEILQNNDYSKSSDVYSFAFIVYEIMNNEIPYKDLSMNQIFTEVVVNENRPDFYKEIPYCYQQLIEKCWDKDPNKRPTFDQIVDYLKKENDFISDSVNRTDFLNYVECIDDYKSSLNESLNLPQFNELIKLKSKIQENE